MSAQRVMPSRFRSETFIFAVLVLSLAFVLPISLSASGKTEAPPAPSATAILPKTTPPAAPIQDILHYAGLPFTDHEKQLPYTPVSHDQSHTQYQQQYNPYQQYAPPMVQQQPAAASPSPVAAEAEAVPVVAKPAPITYLIPYIGSAIAWSFRLITRLPTLVISLTKILIIRPLSYPAGVILAILRPLILLLEIIYILTLYVPFTIISWFVREAIYPLYVFAGVAVLLGALVGVSASQVSKGAKLILDNMAAKSATIPRAAIQGEGPSRLKALKGKTASMTPPQYELPARTPQPFAPDEFENPKYWGHSPTSADSSSAPPSAIGTRIRSRLGF